MREDSRIRVILSVEATRRMQLDKNFHDLNAKLKQASAEEQR